MSIFVLLNNNIMKYIKELLLRFSNTYLGLITAFISILFLLYWFFQLIWFVLLQIFKLSI